MASYLMNFHRLTGDLEISEYSNSTEAMRERLELERKTSDPNIEIVVINSPNLEQLKISHSRYFAPETPTRRTTESVQNIKPQLTSAHNRAV